MKKSASGRTGRVKNAEPARRSGPARARRPQQKFTVSHHREEDFDAGLRTYSAYRDLGIAPATGGLVQAHVIRMTKPFDEAEVAIPHYHDVQFQMIYVLKGWFKSEFEGEGVQTFRAGCVLDPAAQDQAHRAWLFRRLRIARDRDAGGFRDGDARVRLVIARREATKQSGVR